LKGNKKYKMKNSYNKRGKVTNNHLSDLFRYLILFCEINDQERYCSKTSDNAEKDAGGFNIVIE